MLPIVVLNASWMGVMHARHLCIENKAGEEVTRIDPWIKLDLGVTHSIEGLNVAVCGGFKTGELVCPLPSTDCSCEKGSSVCGLAIYVSNGGSRQLCTHVTLPNSFCSFFEGACGNRSSPHQKQCCSLCLTSNPILYFVHCVLAAKKGKCRYFLPKPATGTRYNAQVA